MHCPNLSSLEHHVVEPAISVAERVESILIRRVHRVPDLKGVLVGVEATEGPDEILSALLGGLQHAAHVVHGPLLKVFGNLELDRTKYPVY